MSEERQEAPQPEPEPAREHQIEYGTELPDPQMVMNSEDKAGRQQG